MLLPGGNAIRCTEKGCWHSYESGQAVYSGDSRTTSLMIK